MKTSAFTTGIENVWAIDFTPDTRYYVRVFLFGELPEFSVCWKLPHKDNENVNHLLFITDDQLFQESVTCEYDVYLVKASVRKLLEMVETNNYDYTTFDLEY